MPTDSKLPQARAGYHPSSMSPAKSLPPCACAGGVGACAASSKGNATSACPASEGTAACTCACRSAPDCCGRGDTEPPAEMCCRGRGEPTSGQRPNRWVVTVASGMATSGCCLLQLGLNLLPAFSSSGCFGLNTRLKKLRPLFALGTLLWFAWWGWCDFGPGRSRQGSERGRAERSGISNRRRFVLTAACSLLISFSPEIIAFISVRRGAAAALQAAERVTISVLDMGCEACSEAVGRALRALPGAVGGMANFKEGTADLLLSKGAGVVGAEQIQEALKAVGYGFGGIVAKTKLK